MEDKRFFWIKLKTDFFQEDSPIDFLLSQPNGSEYIVLYIKLCLMTANGNGKLQKQIGEMIIPYDVDKITRDMKYFSRDTVIVALEMYKKLGLVYQDADGILTIANHEKLVGSETAAAERMRKSREKAKMRNNVTPELHERSQQCYLENRDKRIENRVEDSRGKEEKITDNRGEEVVVKSQSVPNVTDSPTQDVGTADIEEIINAWNTLGSMGIAEVYKVVPSSKRYGNLKTRIKQYGKDAVLKAIENIRSSSFLCGDNKKGWTITFDWFVLPNNFIKVWEGNYNTWVQKDTPLKKGGDNLDGVREWLNEVRRNDMGADGSSTESSVSSKDLFGF